jgi:hypothetical protein
MTSIRYPYLLFYKPAFFVLFAISVLIGMVLISLVGIPKSVSPPGVLVICGTAVFVMVLIALLVNNFFFSRWRIRFHDTISDKILDPLGVLVAFEADVFTCLDENGRWEREKLITLFKTVGFPLLEDQRINDFVGAGSVLRYFFGLPTEERDRIVQYYASRASTKFV